MKMSTMQKILKAAACVNHGGKMKNVISISTSPLVNVVCNARAKNPASICAHCFSRRMMKVYPALAAKLERNYNLLTTVELDDADIPKFAPRSGFLRFEAFGDLATPLQVKNYFTIARVNGHLNCALWTKNPQIIKKAIEIYGIEKPENLNIIFSVAGLNSTAAPMIYEALQENGYEFIDKVFTVYDDANAGGVNINCGARDCATCGRCYLKNDTVFINEKLK